MVEADAPQCRTPLAVKSRASPPQVLQVFSANSAPKAHVFIGETGCLERARRPEAAALNAKTVRSLFGGEGAPHKRVMYQSMPPPCLKDSLRAARFLMRAARPSAISCPRSHCRGSLRRSNHLSPKNCTQKPGSMRSPTCKTEPTNNPAGPFLSCPMTPRRASNGICSPGPACPPGSSTCEAGSSPNQHNVAPRSSWACSDACRQGRPPHCRATSGQPQSKGVRPRPRAPPSRRPFPV